MSASTALLDLEPYPADRYAMLADRCKAIMGTRNDVVFVQAEAILALEAAATSLARPGLVALNVVTSPYGAYVGNWLRRAGATVQVLAAEDGRPIAADAVAAALAALPRIDLVAMVHAETSSGILNPLPEIAALARARGALLLVDAVASLGGHHLDVDELGIDLCVAGPQKALAGPSGVSIVSVGPRAWAAMSPQPAPSSLSLLDLRTNWLERGRGVLPGMPSALEFWALEAALDRLEREGLAACIVRHQRAARATRSALRVMGANLWIERDDQASALATAVRVLSEDAGFLAERARGLGAAVSQGFGSIADRLVRLDHTGRRAERDAVLANLSGYARAAGIAFDATRIAAVVDQAFSPAAV